MIKKAWVFSLLLLAIPALSQTPDALVLTGRDWITKSNFAQADAAFTKALTASPNHETANFFKAMARLAQIPSHAAVNGLLTKCGFATTGRNIFNWTAELRHDSAGNVIVPSVNTSEAVTVIKSTLLPAILAAQTNLSKVTSQSFLVETTSREAEFLHSQMQIDYGDVQLLRAMLYGTEFMMHMMTHLNVNVVLKKFEDLEKAGQLDIGHVLAAYPDLLKRIPNAYLPDAERAIRNGIEYYLAASEFIRNPVSRPSQDLHLFALDPEDSEKEADFRDTLGKVLLSLDTPIRWDQDDDPLVFLGAYFRFPGDPRSLLPTFKNGDYVRNSLPDYSFAGGLLKINPAEVEETLRKEFIRGSSGVYIGNLGYEYDMGVAALFIGTNGSGRMLVYSDMENFALNFPADFSEESYWYHDTDSTSTWIEVDEREGFYGSYYQWQGQSFRFYDMTGEFTGEIGPFEAASGLYEGQFTLGARDGGMTGILSSQGDLVFTAVYPDGSAATGGRAMLDSTGLFRTQESNWLIVEGSLNATAKRITGILTNASSQETGTFTISRTALASPAAPVAPPVITRQPADTTAALGESFTFEVGVSVPHGTVYCWYQEKDGVIYEKVGATGSRLTIPDALEGDAGRYWAVAANISGETTSQPATLTIVPESVKPVVTITQPRTNEVFTSMPILLKGTATDNASVARVDITINSRTPELADLSGTNWSKSVTLDAGTNWITVQAVDATGNISLPRITKVVYKQIGTLILHTNGQGTITAPKGPYFVGQSYKITAAPKAGYLFSSWSGTQPSSSSTFTFIMQPTVDLTANFEVNPLPPYKGTYNGLFLPPTADTNPELISADNSGFFTATITDKGLVSGKVQMRNNIYPFSNLQLSPQGQGNIQFARGKLSPAMLFMELDMQSADHRLYGSLIIDHGKTNETISQITAYLAAGTNYMGSYTYLLQGTADTNSPGGHSAGTLTVDKSAGVSFNGKLADGSPFSLKSKVGTQGVAPIFNWNQSMQALVIGWLQFTNSPSTQNHIEGTLSWLQAPAANASVKMYRSGFATRRTFWGAPYANRKNQGAVAWSSGILEIGGDNMTPIQVPVTWQSKKLSVGTNTAKVKLTLNEAQGTFNGSFTHPVNKKSVNLTGTILSGKDWGGGWFLGSSQSGYFRIGAEIQDQPGHGDWPEDAALVIP